MLDNDHIVTDFMRHLERTFGQEQAERCLDIFRELRDELGYADSPAPCSATASPTLTTRTF